MRSANCCQVFWCSSIIRCRTFCSKFGRLKVVSVIPEDVKERSTPLASWLAPLLQEAAESRCGALLCVCSDSRRWPRFTVQTSDSTALPYLQRVQSGSQLLFRNCRRERSKEASKRSASPVLLGFDAQWITDSAAAEAPSCRTAGRKAASGAPSRCRNFSKPARVRLGHCLR